MAITNLQIADSAKVVTPSDSTVFEDAVLYVGSGGDVAVETIAGETVTFTNVPDGNILYVMVRKVLETGTTASDLRALR